METKQGASSRQVLKNFLFRRAQDFLKTRPEESKLTRSQRRAIARDMSRRLASQSLEEIRKEFKDADL